VGVDRRDGRRTRKIENREERVIKLSVCKVHHPKSQIWMPQELHQ
jgi:hypothetical protein